VSINLKHASHLNNQVEIFNGKFLGLNTNTTDNIFLGRVSPYSIYYVASKVCIRDSSEKTFSKLLIHV